MSTGITFTPKQKEVFLAMKAKANVLRFVGSPVCRFVYNGKPIRHDLVHGLKNKGLIKVDIKTIDQEIKSFILTDFGQQITF